LRSELSNPLFRNAYALMANGGLTGVLGLGYWLLAARFYDPAQVGRQSAQNQAMMFLGGLTALNFILIRFIPEMGRRTGALVFRTYIAGCVAAGTLAVGFLLTLGWWGPSFAHLAGTGRGMFFVAAVVSWSLFTAQDGVLTGLRRATWVLGKNTTFAALKVVLLVALAAALPHDGITTSWTVSAVVLLVPLEVLVRRRFISRHIADGPADRAVPTGAQIGRYLAGDYTGTLFYYALCNLVPVVVATGLDASTNAYFYLAWVLGATVDVLAVNMAMSLTVEGAFDAAGLPAACRSALTRMTLILCPIALAMLVFAHPGLALFGPEYARHGAPLLRLLALSTLPKAVIEVYIGMLRVQRRTRLVALLQGLRFAGVLLLVLAPARGPGVTGPGYAVLAVSTAVAVAVLPPLLRVARRPGTGRAEPGDGSAPAEATGGAPATTNPSAAAADLPAVPPDAAALDAAPATNALDADGIGRGGIGPDGVGSDDLPNPVAVETTGSAPDRLVPPAKPRKRRADRGRPVEPIRATARGTRRHATLAWALFVAGLALYWLPLRHVHLRRMNGYGLISVLPVATLAGGGLLVAAFMVTLWLRRPHRALLLLQLIAIIVSLHGLAPALEAYARPPTAWQHDGFVEYIARTGRADYSLDARFSWPGFFALIAFVTRAAGVSDLEPVMHWTPVVSQLLYLAPMYLILRVLRMNWRGQWFAAWLFVAADWVGQDYFSPQGFGYLLYLLVIGILLNWFRPASRPIAGAARSGRVRTFLIGPLTCGERPSAETTVATRTVLLLLLVVLFAVATASHQLTPFLILFVCAALVVVRRSTATGLPVLMAVIVAGWVGFMTTAYWAGHSSDLFSGMGALLSNLTGGVAGRVSGGSEGLATVQTGRILIAGTVMILAAAGAMRRRLRRIDDRVALVLLVTPFLAAGLQNYGGEIALRVYFFVIPGACVLVAYLFFPTTFTAVRRTAAICAAAVCALAIAGGFVFVRFGNETFEQIRPGDVRAFDAMLRETPNNVINAVWLADPEDDAGYFPMMPWGARRMEHFDYTAVRAPRNPADVSGIMRALRDRPNGYFVTTRGNEAYNHYNYGLPASYGARMRTALAAASELRPVLVNDDAAVYALRVPPGGTSPPPARPPHLSVRHTTWTPVGLCVAPLLIVLLVAREILRIRPRGRRVWPARTLTAASAVLVVVLAAVVIERFLVLGG
jgi:O-antigen/teichoic acid export membrane protein